MDDHLYEEIISYAECELIPRFRREYAEYGSVTACPSYEEVRDLCTALNAVSRWAGYAKVKPADLVKEGV